MDVKFLFSFLLTFSFCDFLVALSVSDFDTVPGPIIVESDSKHGTCKTTLNTCKISSGDLGFLVKSGAKGEKGDKGDTGTSVKGDTGEKGDKGNNGEPGQRGLPGTSGLQGPPGPKGDKGEYGKRGEKGTIGNPGESGRIGDTGPAGKSGNDGKQGERGEKGEKGTDGINGAKGDTGSKGERGDKGFDGAPGREGPNGLMGLRGRAGPPGSPGAPGVCPCYPAETTFPDEEGAETLDIPLSTVCKSSVNLSIKSGIYNFTAPRLFEAYCNMTTGMTCLQRKSVDEDIDYERISPLNTDGKLWLSQMNAFNLTKLYGIDRDQIMWLQKQSTSATQTLRIHSKNIKIYDSTGDDIQIRLLTWNDKVIGTYPTSDTPFFYTVTENDNNCRLSTDISKWCFIDIKLVTDSHNRLPIIDIRFNEVIDTEDGKYYIYLENVELCFG